MKRAGPLLTLAAAAVLGGGLLITDIVTDPTDDTADRAAVTTSAGAATTSAGAGPSAAASSAANVPAAPSGAAPGAGTSAAPGSAAPSAFPAQADYVAVIPAQPRSITLSITVTGKQAVAYACDGASVESWLRGAADAGRMSLTGKNSELQATLKDNVLTGTLTLDNRAMDFTAPLVQAPAGIYYARSNGTRDSWIVRPDGSVTGVRRQSDGTTTPAPTLAPDARKVHGDDTDF
ncbi:hypothetical protein ACFVUS_36820 [Nocardia sp. NPDC058058]|uniref:hypothetical protein n=1 Tax=Nocardia sp. NPDC058058 TaxID=3346317 RepID=UPI0036D9F83C